MKYKNLTAEKLEFILPMTFQRQKKKNRPCGSRCPLGQTEEAVTYKQHLWRSDSFSSGHQIRMYEISYMGEFGDVSDVYRTRRHYSFRDALIEMYEILIKAGIIEPYKEAERGKGN